MGALAARLAERNPLPDGTLTVGAGLVVNGVMSYAFLGFACVDPWKGKAAVRQARTLVERHGVKGFKFHPSLQAFHHATSCNPA